MPKRNTTPTDKAKIVPYSAPAAYHLFVSLLSAEKFGRPNSSLGLRQIIRELAKQEEYAPLFAEAQRLAAAGETVPEPTSKGTSIFALQEIHAFFLLYPWGEMQELNGSLGLQMTVLAVSQYEPYQTAWQQIRAHQSPTVAIPHIGSEKDSNGGRAVDYSCPLAMHTFLQWLGEGNRPLGVRRAVYALAEQNTAVADYLAQAAAIGHQSHLLMEQLRADTAAREAFQKRTGITLTQATKHSERQLLEWALLHPAALAAELGA